MLRRKERGHVYNEESTGCAVCEQHGAIKSSNGVAVKTSLEGTGMNSVSGTCRQRGTHLGEVEEGRLTEQDVGQEHGAARQHFNLVFTIMMAPQELNKVPAEERVGGVELLSLS